MSDYSELVKALRCCSEDKCGQCNYNWNPNREFCMNSMCSCAADAIEELTESNNALHETVTNLLNTIRDIGKWISVEDELPRHNAVVVVSDGKRSWDVGQYHFLVDADDRTRWWWKKHTTRKVLWWMYKEDSIPEPPKGDA